MKAESKKRKRLVLTERYSAKIDTGSPYNRFPSKLYSKTTIKEMMVINENASIPAIGSEEKKSPIDKVNDVRRATLSFLILCWNTCFLKSGNSKATARSDSSTFRKGAVSEIEMIRIKSKTDILSTKLFFLSMIFTFLFVCKTSSSLL